MNHRDQGKPAQDPTRAWRSLEEWHGAQDENENEFPAGCTDPPDGVTRRSFIKLVGASATLATAQACRRAATDERIIPYTHAPEGVVPGIPDFYATALVMDGYATGMMVESHVGHPTKVEGNPQHPASLGASSAWDQTALWQLYDPDRASGFQHRNLPSSYEALVKAFTQQIPPGTGRGVHVVMPPTSSLLHAELIRSVRVRLPGVQFHFHTPLPQQSTWDGSRVAFGRVVETLPLLEGAQTILLLDADILGSGRFHLRHAREFADGRRVRSPQDSMNRLYVVEPIPTVSGMAADHRLPMRRREIANLTAALLQGTLDALGSAPPRVPPSLAEALRHFPLTIEHQRWARVVAKDLVAHAPRAVAVAGDAQPPTVHAMVHLINASLGAYGTTVHHLDPVVFEAGEASHGLHVLSQALKAGQVEVLFILDANPAYDAPADLDMAGLIPTARHSVFLGLYENETAQRCHWFLPAAHALESWGDARAADGTITFMQPLIRPLYNGRSVAEVLSVLTGQPRDGYTLLRDFWQTRYAGASFESFWQDALRVGLLPDSAHHPLDLQPDMPAIARSVAQTGMALSGEGLRSLELVFETDPRVRDGRFSNVAWLMELPDPVTKLTWDNAVLLSPAMAQRLGLVNGSRVVLQHGERTVQSAALVDPGMAEECLGLTLGYGRGGAEQVARGVGTNAYPLRDSHALHVVEGVQLRKVEGQHRLALTQMHWSMHGRDLVKHETLDGYRRHPDFAHQPTIKSKLLYQVEPKAQVQWAMMIDLNACIGCNACMLACQAENNVPVVGKEGVLLSREMHWLRIDRYFIGSPDNPRTVNQPMLCQHCEMAPCEYVCPVNATVHSPDGLNEMIYNRCVGTRFCSNNCPYKVRRFNFFSYTDGYAPSQKMAQNPDVTVRDRGVMEKCTYCVQRIRSAEIAAKVENRSLDASSVRTACQQACPTQAISFGSLTQTGSEVARLADNPRTYSVLHHLGTQPRTRYLARLFNPNPEFTQG